MIWVIFWRYYDGTACGVVRAYDYEQAASADLEILSAHSPDKMFTLEYVPYIKANYGAKS